MGLPKLCVVQLSSSMKLAALAFAALAVMAVAVDVSENIHELDDDLAMVEVMHGAGGACDTEIRAAKAKCGERLAYFKKIHESSCGDKDLARVMGRIKRNHAKTKKQQAQLVLGEAVGDEAGRVGERVVVGLEGGAVPASLVGAIGAGAVVVLEAVAARVGRTLQVAQLLEGAELAGNQRSDEGEHASIVNDSPC